MLELYYKNVVRQDFITKFYYKNFLQITSLEKIILSFSINQSSLKNLLPLLSALLLISSQRPYFLRSKRINLTLRLKSGSPIGCKVDLRGKEKYFFFERLVFFILPQMKDFEGFDIFKQSFFLRVENLFYFREIEKEYEHFSDLPPLSVNFVLKAVDERERLCLLGALKLPLKLTKKNND